MLDVRGANAPAWGSVSKNKCSSAEYQVMYIGKLNDCIIGKNVTALEKHLVTLDHRHSPGASLGLQGLLSKAR